MKHFLGIIGGLKKYSRAQGGLRVTLGSLWDYFGQFVALLMKSCWFQEVIWTVSWVILADFRG